MDVELQKATVFAPTTAVFSAALLHKISVPNVTVIFL